MSLRIASLCGKEKGFMTHGFSSTIKFRNCDHSSTGPSSPGCLLRQRVGTEGVCPLQIPHCHQDKRQQAAGLAVERGKRIL